MSSPLYAVSCRGTPGENGGPAGDLWLIIRIAPHPLFDIVGHNLEIVPPLAPWEAALDENERLRQENRLLLQRLERYL